MEPPPGRGFASSAEGARKRVNRSRSVAPGLQAVEDEVEIAGRMAQVGEHGRDLAPVLRAVIRALEHRLPARDLHRSLIANPQDRLA